MENTKDFLNVNETKKVKTSNSPFRAIKTIAKILNTLGIILGLAILTASIILIGEFGGISLVIGIPSGGLVALLFIAYGEIIKLFLRIEENTRRNK